MKRFLAILAAGVVAAAAVADDYSKCFIPGETVRYKASWLGLPIAWSETKTDTVVENGRELIRIRMISRSYKAYTHIYKVDNATEVIIDPETALPIRLAVKQDEGGQKKSQLTIFNHEKRFAIFQDRIKKKIKVVAINRDTRDILSFIYASRKKPLKEAAKERYILYVGGKLYSLDLKIRDTDKIRLPEYGKVKSTEILPIADFDGLFLRKGKVFIWVSQQNHRMVTCMKAKVAVGKVSIKLQEASGTGDEFWDRKKE